MIMHISSNDSLVENQPTKKIPDIKLQLIFLFLGGEGWINYKHNKERKKTSSSE